MVTETVVDVRLRQPHAHQSVIRESTAKYKVVRGGRRGGKTVLSATIGVEQFLSGHRVLYAAPSVEQVGKFWYEVKRALQGPIDAGMFRANETEHVIEEPGTERRIKCKTASDANSLRGDYADYLVLDEWQLMAEDTWDEVGRPMLLDNDGDAMFIYTPPSLYSSGRSKAKDPRHAAKMWKAAKEDKTGRWAAFHFTSHDNPHISRAALDGITEDMTREAYRREIMAEDDDQDSKLLVYATFNEASQLREAFPISQEWPRYVAHDFGLANPAALFIAENAAGYWVYDEYLPGPGVSAMEHVQRWQEKVNGLNVMMRVGGNATTEEETRQLYSAQGWPITAPVYSKVNDQIRLTQALVEKNRVFVFKTCKRFIEEMRNCLFETDEQGQRLDKVRDEAKYHLLACFRYFGGSVRQEVRIHAGGKAWPRYGGQRAGILF